MGSKAAKDELTPLAGRIVELTTERGLIVVPVAPSGRDRLEVDLDPQDMSVEAFLDLAVAAGQKLAYVESTLFEASDFERLNELASADAEELGPDAHRELMRLVKSAQRFEGWPIALQAVFVHEGVVHRWATEAEWFEEFEGAAAHLFSDQEEEEVEEQSDGELEAFVERTSNELLQLTKFRAAGTDKDRERAAHAHFANPDRAPDPLADRLPPWAQNRAIRHACEAAALEQERVYDALEQRIPELARMIGADDQYLRANAAARKHRIRDLLMEEAEKYAPPTRIVDLVTSELAAGRGRTPAPMLPFD